MWRAFEDAKNVEDNMGEWPKDWTNNFDNYENGVQLRTIEDDRTSQWTNGNRLSRLNPCIPMSRRRTKKWIKKMFELKEDPFSFGL